MSVGRRSSVVFAATIVVLAFASFLGAGLRIDADLARLLPDSDPTLARATAALGDSFERTLVDVEARTSDVGPDTLGAAAEHFATVLASADVAASVRAQVDLEAALALVDVVRAHVPLFLDDAAWAELETRLTPARVRAALATLERRIQEPDGAHLARTAADDPLGFANLALAPLASLSGGFGSADDGARLDDGRITSADGRHVLVLVEPGFASSDTARGARLLAALEAAAAATVEAYPGVGIRHLGAHRSTLENERAIRRDVALTSSVGLAAVFLLAFLCFGRLRHVLFALSPALVGVVCALGVFGLLRDTIAAPVLGFGAVLIGLSIDFAVHVLAARTQSPPRPIPTQALVFGALSTSLAFGLLGTSALPGLRDVGLFGAVGITAAALFALFVLPCCEPWFGAARTPRLDLARLLARLGTPRRTALVALVVTPLVALGAARLEFDGDVQKLSSLGPVAAADESAIRATWGGARVSTLFAEGATLEEALVANDALERELARARAEGRLASYASLSTLLPSKATQRARAERWAAFWTAARRTALSAALDAALEGTGFRRAAFDPFLAALEARPPGRLEAAPSEAAASRAAAVGPERESLTPLGVEELRAAGVGALLDDRLAHVAGGWRVSTPVTTADWNQFSELATRLASTQPDVVVANAESLMRTIASLVKDEVLVLGCLAFLAVLLVVAAWTAESVLTAVVLVPLGFGLVWTLGLLGWTRTPLNLGNGIFVVFQFGIAVDYAIFLAASYRERRASGVDRTAETRAAALFCALSSCLGFGALAFARHPVLHTVGVAAALGIASAALATQLFVPVLCRSVLAAAGPNGVPSPRNIVATVWFQARLALHRWRMAFGGLARDEALRAVARDVGYGLPIGRRVFTREEEAPSQEPCLYVADEASELGGLCLLALVPHARLALPPSLARLPMGGALFRGAPDEAPAAALAAGRSAVAFLPRTEAEQAGAAAAAFDLAHERGLPVRPIALAEAGVLRQPGGWIGDHDVAARVLAPLPPAPSAAALAQAAAARIRARRDPLRLETLQGPGWYRELAGMYRQHGPFVKNYAASKAKRDPLVRALPALVDGEGPVLVVGCGYGVMTARLATAAPRRALTALDPDERKLRAARAALGPDFPVRFLAEDVRQHDTAPYREVLLVDVLHYWSEDEQRAILAHLRSGMNEGTKLLFRDGCRTPGARHWLVAGAEALAVATGFTRGHGGFTFHTEDGWTALLASAGFRVRSRHPDLGVFSNLVLSCEAVPVP